MKARFASFVIWAAVAASAIFWVLRLGVSSPAAPAHTVAVGPAATPRGDLTRLFGATPASDSAPASGAVQTPLSSRFKLLGVAAPRQGGDRVGLALIAVDGKPARGYAVGAAVDGDIVLQSVHARGAKLGARDAAPQVSLDLPALPLPATGTLPPPPAAGAPTGVPGASPPAVGVSPRAIGAAPPAIGAAQPAVPTAAEAQPGEPILVPPPPGSVTR